MKLAAHVALLLAAVLLSATQTGAQFEGLFDSFRSLFDRVGTSFSNTARRGGSFFNQQQTSTKTLRNFNFFNCGSGASLVSLQAINVQEPVVVPGVVTVSGSGYLSQTIQGRVRAQTRLCRRIFGGCVDIPCIDDFGTCQYDDLCSRTDELVQALGGCPLGPGRCSCPIAAGQYNVNNFRHTVVREDVSLATNSLASAVVDGDYEMTIRGDVNGREIGCVRMTFSIE